MDEAAALADGDRRDEEEHLVDEVFGEERRRQGRAAFEQKRLDAIRGERTQLVLERPGAQLELRSFRERAAAEREPAGLAHGVDLARVEARLRGAPRAHADGGGIRRSAQLMHQAPRRLAGDPPAAGDCDAPVERDGDLVGDVRAAERLPRAPGLVLAARFIALEQLDLDAGRAYPLDPAGGDGVRIERTDDDARDSRVDHGVGARRRAPVVRARLERDVERGAACTLTRLSERARLGVVDRRVLVPALADDLVLRHDHSPDERMICDFPAASLGELERPLEVIHARACTRRRYERGRSSRWKIEAPATINVAPAS